jgi:hypothetical protein
VDARREIPARPVAIPVEVPELRERRVQVFFEVPGEEPRARTMKAVGWGVPESRRRSNEDDGAAIFAHACKLGRR